MGKREKLAAAYIEALPARPLFVLAGPCGRPARMALEPSRKFETAAEVWFAKAAHLELVAARVRSDLTALGAARPQEWFDLSGDEVRNAVINAAGMLGASWRTRADIQRDADAAVEQILGHVEAQRRSGGLAKVNAEYKLYRQRQAEAGQTAVPYSVHLMAFTRSLVVLAAENGHDTRTRPNQTL